MRFKLFRSSSGSNGGSSNISSNSGSSISSNSSNSGISSNRGSSSYSRSSSNNGSNSSKFYDLSLSIASSLMSMGLKSARILILQSLFRRPSVRDNTKALLCNVMTECLRAMPQDILMGFVYTILYCTISDDAS